MRYFYTIGIIFVIAASSGATGTAEVHTQLSADTSGIQTSLHNSSVHIYPNPVLEELHISIEQPAHTAYEIFVLDALGQKVKLPVHISKNPGQLTYTFRFQNQPKGVYFIRITSADHQAIKTYKVLKVVK